MANESRIYTNDWRDPNVIGTQGPEGRVYLDKTDPHQTMALRMMNWGPIIRYVFRHTGRSAGYSNRHTTFWGNMGDTTVRGRIRENTGSDRTGGASYHMEVVFVQGDQLTGYLRCGFEPYAKKPFFDYMQRTEWWLEKLGKLLAGRLRKPAQYKPNNRQHPFMEGFGRPRSAVFDFIGILASVDRTDPLAIAEAAKTQLQDFKIDAQPMNWPWTERIVKKGRKGRGFPGWNREGVNNALMRELHSE